MSAAQRLVNAAEVRAARNCRYRYTGERSTEPGETIEDAREDVEREQADLRDMLNAMVCK